jgi:hypothetical protein
MTISNCTGNSAVNDVSDLPPVESYTQKGIELSLEKLDEKGRFHTTYLLTATTTTTTYCYLYVQPNTTSFT